MACHAAISKKYPTIPQDATVEKALEVLAKGKVSAAPVTGKGGVYLGVFSLENLFKNLLPVSVAMADGIQLDVSISAAPGVAKRLKKIQPLPVTDFLLRKVTTVAPGTPLWEGVQVIVRQNGILPVVDSESGKLMGVINELSMMAEMERLANE